MTGKDPNQTPSILLVDDDRQVLQSMGSWLNSLGYEVTAVDSFEGGVNALESRSFELILLDVRLRDRDGFELLKIARDIAPESAVIMITGYGSVETAIEALRAGAFDLLTKPLIDKELETSIARALKQREVIRENKTLKAQLDQKFGLESVVGNDHRMQRIYEMIDSVADTRATVLITGESGTGKSLIARAIHRASNRSDEPFVEIACGALPENLLESELFGHVEGAFTGATSNKIGKFKHADKGTIFLDEIGTAPQSLQVKLLRVLQELQFEPVGGVDTISVDTRVILATNEDLEQAVAESRFRQDLFYRINVINLELPPLRERLSDIPKLAEYFLRNTLEETGKSIDGFDTRAIQALQQYHWPGNVRELQNVIERAVLLGKGNVIQADDFPGHLSQSVPSPMSQSNGTQSLKEALEGPERQIILQVLKQFNWNRNATADALGINRTTLYKKMKRLGLESAAGQLS